ncbi:hypothetical protein HK096_002738 [Nowakowskiella sp. JEL0078]|nr:hypothetical protein HK096_002738 [Nowakowskiella sp. JEL0078]
MRIEGPGTSNCTPGTFAKMMAFAFSQQRITYDSTKHNVLPFSGPEELWEKLFKSRELLGTMTELFAFTELYGFSSENSLICNPPLFVKAVFPSPRKSNFCTPIIFVELRRGEDRYSIESIFQDDLPDDQVQISCYIPGIFRSRNHSECFFTVYIKTFLGGMPFYDSGGEIKFSDMEIFNCDSHDWRDLTLGAMGSYDTENQSLLNIDYIHEISDSQYQVRLLLTDATKNSTFLEKGGAGERFTGLKIDDKSMEILLPCDVILSSCKIHRKSGFLLLEFTKLSPKFPAVTISFRKFRTETKVNELSIGMMFVGDYGLVKQGSQSLSSLSKVHQDLHQMKENIRRDCGCPLLSQIVHPIDSSHYETPIIDISFVFFIESDDINVFQALNETGHSQHIVLERDKMANMKNLMQYYHCNTLKLDRSPHQSIKKIKGQFVFKRCIIHPLYSRDMKPIFDSEKEKRSTLRNAKQKAMEMWKIFQKGDAAEILKLFNS